MNTTTFFTLLQALSYRKTAFTHKLIRTVFILFVFIPPCFTREVLLAIVMFTFHVSLTKSFVRLSIIWQDPSESFCLWFASSRQVTNSRGMGENPGWHCLEGTFLLDTVSYKLRKNKKKDYCKKFRLDKIWAWPNIWASRIFLYILISFEKIFRGNY